MDWRGNFSAFSKYLAAETHENLYGFGISKGSGLVYEEHARVYEIFDRMAQGLERVALLPVRATAYRRTID